MFRKDLIPLLLNHPMPVAEIARQCHAPLKEAAQALQHVALSLKHSDDYRLKVYPAVCRKCEFTFSADKLTKPSKCPHCRSSWIDEPLVETQRA